MRTTMLKTVPLTPGTCEWCGKDCELEDMACSLSCEALIRREEAAQGMLVIRSLKAWRRKPNHAARNAAIAEIVPVIDRFLSNDRKRREEAAAKRRQQAADAAAKAAKGKAPEAPQDAPTAPQTAAPVIDQPEVGDLDGGLPQSHDANRRGFDPK